MLRYLKFCCGLMLLLVTAPAAFAFTLWGPLETFQTAALSYGTRFWYSPVFFLNAEPTTPGGEVYTELGGPKDYGQGSRLNVPTLTYGYDVSFLKYYGPEGVKAVDAAFAILNRLPAASAATPDLTEFIQQGNQQINYTARALDMLDLKSTVLQLMIEHMGLLGETHVYDLLSQTVVSGCDSLYTVAIRNLDPLNPANHTPYVNGTLYGGYIYDGCSAGTAIADALELAYVGAPGGLNIGTSAVATAEALQIGGYYLGITRDDFGGLRYLYSKNNFNAESMAPNTYVGSTITSQFFPVGATNVTDNTWSGLVGGVEKITYVKVGYDSGIGSTFQTNIIHYNLTVRTNNHNSQVTVYRTNSGPDILFTAANLLNLPVAGADEPFIRTYGTTTGTQTGGGTTTAGFIAPPVAPVYAGSVESQVITPYVLITFNNVGPVVVGTSQNFIQDSTAFLQPFFQFGSFDGSTNPPVVFPVNTSLGELISLALSAPTTPTGTAVSPFNPILTTSTTTAGGVGGAANGGGTTVGGGAAGAVAHKTQ